LWASGGRWRAYFRAYQARPVRGPLRALDLAIGGTPAPNLLQYLPHTALAAVVIAAAIGLVEVADLRRIYRVQWWEFWLSMVCFAGVAVFGAIPGIALAVVIAVIEFLWDGWRPQFNDRALDATPPASSCASPR